MSRLIYWALVAAALVSIPAIVAAWWWFRGPAYHRARLLADTEEGLESDLVDVLFQRAKARLKEGRPGLAAADAREVLRHASLHFEARLLLAQCLLSEAKMAEAESELQVCRKLRPDRAAPRIGLASCVLERGAMNEAQKLVQEALALEPTSSLALHLQGNLYLRRQCYDLALGEFQKIIRLNPKDKEGHLKLAQILSRQGDLEQATKHQQVFQQLDREDAERTGKRRGPRPSGVR